MTVFFSTALKVLNSELKGKHITTMFSPFIGEGKISTSNQVGDAIITDVLFWENANVIVAIVDCPLALERYAFFSNMGYVYDLKYIAHITIEKTDKDNSNAYKHLIGNKVSVGEEYFKPFYKK
jgi:hypothetical protein